VKSYIIVEKEETKLHETRRIRFQPQGCNHGHEDVRDAADGTEADVTVAVRMCTTPRKCNQGRVNVANTEEDVTAAGTMCMKPQKNVTDTSRM
jgi:hypothetical protein